MTVQNLFDTVVTAIIKQGKAAVDERGDCMYRAPDGCKCAVGHVLPDDVYHPDMEGQLLWDLTDRLKKGGGPLFSTEEMELLELLQQDHDEAHSTAVHTEDNFVEVFKSRTRATAIDFALNTEALQ